MPTWQPHAQAHNANAQNTSRAATVRMSMPHKLKRSRTTHGGNIGCAQLTWPAMLLLVCSLSHESLCETLRTHMEHTMHRMLLSSECAQSPNGTHGTHAQTRCALNTHCCTHHSRLVRCLLGACTLTNHYRLTPLRVCDIALTIFMD